MSMTRGGGGSEIGGEGNGKVKIGFEVIAWLFGLETRFLCTVSSVNLGSFVDRKGKSGSCYLLKGYFAMFEDSREGLGTIFVAQVL